MKTLLIGSQDPVAIGAIVSAIVDLIVPVAVLKIDAPSYMNRQLFGFGEIFQGACNRAHHALALKSKVTAAAIGSECGIVPKSGQYFYFDALQIVTVDGCLLGTWSKPLPLPSVHVHEAHMRGFSRVTVGEVVVEAYQFRRQKFSPFDIHTILTGGQVTRKQILAEAAKKLFRQALLKGWFN